ncbi:unnamed protein product [Moneuplotes crassus]|uniref:Steroid 5-alpha reductase C-terminal domain-containing protein n=2 Tax=Euplotes crassus TaxID=5936 RepID=A0AAD2D1M3_EUPCR|nr:unnamed protein product [Moneuplotes crassus]
MNLSPIELLTGTLWYWLPAFCAWAMLHLTYLIGKSKDEYSLIDIAWGMGFVIQTSVQLLILYFTSTDSLNWRAICVTICVAAWGLRLSWHIGLNHEGEDWRYVILRKRFHDDDPEIFQKKIYRYIFMLQWTLMTIACYSPCNIIIWSTNNNVTIFDILGVSIFLFGFFFEAIGDHQLNKYREKRDLATRNGTKMERYCKEGLWAYTRHPNYFGEVVVWWGIFLLSFGNNPNGFCYFSILSPILMNYLLRYRSGVPFLEKKHMKDPEFQEYASRVSPFIPWIPKPKKVTSKSE